MVIDCKTQKIDWTGAAALARLLRKHEGETPACVMYSAEEALRKTHDEDARQGILLACGFKLQCWGVDPALIPALLVGLEHAQPN